MKVTGFLKIRRWMALFIPVTTTVRERLRDYFLALSLLPSGPRFVDDEEARQPLTNVLTDEVVEHEGLVVRFLSSDHVRFDMSYPDWIAPLSQLPANLTGEEFSLAVKQLPDFRPDGPNLFPLETYLQSLPGNAVDWAQRCRCSRQPAVDWALALTKQPGAPAQALDSTVLFIYGLSAPRP